MHLSCVLLKFSSDNIQKTRVSCDYKRTTKHEFMVGSSGSCLFFALTSCRVFSTLIGQPASTELAPLKACVLSFERCPIKYLFSANTSYFTVARWLTKTVRVYTFMNEKSKCGRLLRRVVKSPVSDAPGNRCAPASDSFHC